MDTELVKGTLSLLILSLLTRSSMYGYELAATVHRDTVINQLFGEGELDWFFFTSNGKVTDTIADVGSGEVATAL